MKKGITRSCIEIDFPTRLVSRKLLYDGTPPHLPDGITERMIR
ncbi:MAG: hypothetical protein OXF02_00700 [Simkaniaceae bacterium]|nr:hypothetical protein [Simkaniaceae bacterium]